MRDEIQFLKELQEELKTQEIDCQAAPRFWTVGDYRMVRCADGDQEVYHVSLPDQDYYGDLEELLKEIRDELRETVAYSDEAKTEFNEIDCEQTAIDWLQKHYDEDAELIPVREDHFIHPNTMFLTKSEAQKHIKVNHYHYSPKAHTYAMTAWRAPKVGKLMEILETFDWDSVEGKQIDPNSENGSDKRL